MVLRRIRESELVAEINQRGMVLKVEPTADELKATILRPSRSIVEPPAQLLDENLLAQLAQGIVDLSVGVAFGYVTLPPDG